MTTKIRKISQSIYVIDFETTGLSMYPHSIPLEIAIYRINQNLTVDYVYDTLISWPKKEKNQIDESWWSDMSGVKYDDLKDHLSLNQVWKLITKHLENQRISSWNVGYDIDKFLRPIMRTHNLSKRLPKFKFDKLPCPMLVAKDILQIPGYHGNKWPSLDEAAYYYDVSLENHHRAKFDTEAAAKIILQMIKKGHYSFCGKCLKMRCVC